ncbi:MAG TPA: OmpH family outer membrane protein [Chthoniobacteraceae bacterium]
MKKAPILLVLALLCSPIGAPAASLKIGTIDMKKIFDSYSKTKDAEQSINDDRDQAKKELDDRVQSLKQLEAEVRKLNDEANNPALGKESKESKVKLRDEKYSELRTMDKEVQEFRDTRQKQLTERSLRVRAEIVEEIQKIINERGKAENYDLIFDRSGTSFNTAPVLLESKDAYDFTNDVITILNKNKKERAAAAAPTGEKAAGAAAPAVENPKKAP